MQSVRFIFWVVLGLLVVPLPLPAQTLHFAPLPMQDAETVVREKRPMLEYLARESGLDFEIEYSTGYAEILDKFSAGEVDLAYLGPLPYVALREQYEAAEPLVLFREPTGEARYTCTVVMFADDRVPLAELHGKSVALTQPLSTCGYLATDHLLRGAGVHLAETEYRYLGRHDEVALAVARGDFRGGGLKTHIAARYEHLGLVRLAETEPLPAFALVANAETVPAELRQRLRDALLALDPQRRSEDAEQVRDWGESLSHGAVPVEDADYAPVRRMLRGSPALDPGMPGLSPVPLPGRGVAP